MTGVQKIGSKNSDGDLVIENLTTLTDAGVIRHTSDMTITMDHTDSMNSDTDASDLTVYFDEDYLNRTTDSQGSTLTINMINTLNLELNDGSSLIEGFEKLTFSVDGQLITVDVSGAELDAVQGLIEAALATAGFNDITVSTYTEEAYFGTNIYHQATNTTYPAGEYAGTYTAFLLTNSGSEELTEGGFTITDGQDDGSLAYSQNDSESTVVDLPISINVELNKVGRDGDGGNLIIGGKDTTGPDKDVDQNDGIEEFNITVLGNEDKPSNLGTITSTNDALKTVTVKSETRTDGSYAALTVRGEGTDVNPFGGTLTTFDANAFKGDLLIGEVVDALNIDTFTATGGGDVTLSETIDGSEDGVNYTVTTGAGDDTFNITLDGDAVDTIGESFALNAGNGDNTVTVDMQGSGESGAGVSVNTTADLDNLSITTGSGADKVTLIGGNNNDVAGVDGDADFNISTGAGSDFVYINSIDDKPDSATAAKGEWKVGTNTGASLEVVLYKATLTVDFAGFEQTVTINTTAANNFIATQVDINNAIIAAIAANPELERLLETELGTGTQELTINSTVEGLNELSISINQKDLVAIATPAGSVTDTQVRIASTADLVALEKGLVETGSTSTAVDTENELITEFNTTANIPGTVNAVDYVLTTDDGGSAAETAVTNVSTIDLGTGANDLVVLNSDADSIQTIVFSATWGKVSVVNFEDNGEAGENNDGLAPDNADTNINVLDFSAWLDDEITPSGSTLSAVRVDETVAIATEFGQNTVVVTDFTTLNAENGATALTFGTLTDNQVLAELNAGNGFATIADPATATTTTIGTNNRDSILLIENNDNLGEYKVYNVEYTDAAGNNTFTKATLIGTIDFGNSVNLTDINVDTIA